MASSQDTFGAAFIDVDEWRDEPRRHRYLHGGFEGTDTRFSFYFPPEELYRGRLFQFLEGGTGGSEHSLTSYMGAVFGSGSAWPFDIVFDRLGGVLLESNQGHFANDGNIGTSGDVELFGASAASATYAKAVAEEMYGSTPHHSYVWGGSGGGLRTIACLENRADVWDGGVAFLIGALGGVSQSWAQAYWWLYCRNTWTDVNDAVAPGGSGDPFATLDSDQRQALAAVYRAGWPRGAENQLWPSGAWMYGWPAMKQNDPTYFDDFWDAPGYLGHDSPERLASVLVDVTCTVTAVRAGAAEAPGNMWRPRTILGRAGDPTLGADPDHVERGSTYSIEVDVDLGDDPYRWFITRATVLTGKAAGRQVYLSQQDGALMGERMTQPDLFDGVEPGDQVRIDNRELVAFAHRWMYEIDLDMCTEEDPATGERKLAPEFSGLGAVLVDGHPIYPQREESGRPSQQSGRIEGKMIHFSCTLDPLVSLPTVPAYERLVRANFGDETDEHYRFWWVENAGHYPPDFLAWLTPDKDAGAWRSRHVTIGGVPDVALLAVVAWVEQGELPPPSTSYHFTGDSGLVLPDTAGERRGVQPVVRLAANGGARAEVKVGEAVTFTGTAEQPPGMGTFVSAKWDFDGTGEFTDDDALSGDAVEIKLETTHTYDTPGTYFVSFRAAAHPEGRKGTDHLPVENGARVRVVVSA